MQIAPIWWQQAAGVRGLMLANCPATMKTVLLVEDGEDDVLLMKRACNLTGIPHQLTHARDGDEAVDYLSGKGPFADATRHPIPHLIFLDIKLPRRNGHEVLQWIRSQPKWGHVPVIMLTASDEPKDIEKAYQLGVTSFLCKISDPDEFAQAIKIIFKYWLQINVPPG